MSVGEIAQLITAIAALGAVFVSLRNTRKIDEVRISVDGRMDELLKITGAEQHAAGVKQGEDNPRPPTV